MFEFPWIAFFVLASPFTWLLFFGVFCALTWACEKEEFGASGFILGALAVVLLLFGDGVLIGKLALTNPWPFLGLVACYLVGSGIWGLIKWGLFTSEKLHIYKDRLNEWLRVHGIMDGKWPANDPSLKESWQKYAMDHYIEYKKGSYPNFRFVVKPYAWEHKKEITSWMVFWPCSLVWTILDDVLVRAVKGIQRMLSGVMDGITNIVWRGVDL